MWVRADFVAPSVSTTFLTDLYTSLNLPPSGCSERSIGFMIKMDSLIFISKEPVENNDYQGFWFLEAAQISP